MPAVVQKYIDTHDIALVIREQKKILSLYRRDITQYDEANSLRIRAVFDRIPAELNEKNKRFFASSVMPGVKFENLGDEFLWLKEAGVALPTVNVENCVFYAPIYMVMFLKKDTLPDKMIYTVGAPLEMGL